VTRNVPAYTIVAGNPARPIRELTPSERDEM
jgi:acetyltransferase-like isoleucine patch superfamily enzyme